MKIGIIPNFTREKAFDVTKNTIAELEKLNIDYYFDINSKNDFAFDIEEFHFIDKIYEFVDVIIAIGGDGSFIHTAKETAVHKKPVLCINAGNLAFLAGLEGNELTLLEKLITGDFSTDKRMMLEVYIKDNNNNKLLGYCLNDVAIARGNEIKLVDLDVFCNDRKINNYRADGVVISTPTGSTAYSWSAGGPVIDPDLQCIMLTPICTHSPLNRSLVFNENSVIRVKPANNAQKVCLSTDGEKTIELLQNSEIIVSKSNYYAEFIRIKSDEFFDILNSKLSQRRI
ncbi:MAG: NAD(+)/NADH kinase [Clostridia bacterium]|nr:NAD(+)/NADH kinase [Clostridia bacterium]